MPIDWNPLKELVENNERFVLSSHVRPDADAVGSELALASVLERLGKTVRIVNPSALPANLKFLDPSGRALKLGESATPEEVLDTDVHIILDTSAWSQLLDVGKVFKKTQAAKAVIDHHVSSDRLGALEFKDTHAEATGTLVCRFIEAMGWPLDEHAAGALFAAIATDTGWFRFPSTTAETLAIASRLIAAGAVPHTIYQELYEQCTHARMRLAGRALSRIETAGEGRIAYLTVTNEDFAETGAVQADTENFVNECLKIAGVVAAFIAIEQPNDRIKVSLRSRVGVDVSGVAERFGGGGHKQAAGAQLPGKIDKVTKKVLAALEEAIKDQPE